MTSTTLSHPSQHSSVPRSPLFPWLRRLFPFFCCILAAAPAYSQKPPGAAPFLMAADADPGTYTNRWATLIYAEAFKRLGIPVKIAQYTLARRTAMVEEGLIDGEVSRIYAYGDSHPELIRVDVPVMDFTFSLFAAKPEVRVQRVEDLAAPNLVVEYRRGVLMCENTLKKFVPAERLSDVPASDQGVKKLSAGRTDVFCDIDIYVRQALNSPDVKDVANVRKLFNIASVPTYPYVNKKHADLVPRLTSVLKQMKAEGLLDAYPRQAERDMGWTR